MTETPLHSGWSVAFFICSIANISVFDFRKLINGKTVFAPKRVFLVVSLNVNENKKSLKTSSVDFAVL